MFWDQTEADVDAETTGATVAESRRSCSSEDCYSTRMSFIPPGPEGLTFGNKAASDAPSCWNELTRVTTGVQVLCPTGIRQPASSIF